MMLQELTETETMLSEVGVAELASRIEGEVIRPNDAAYEERRVVWNGMIDRYPAIIVRPAHTQDVVTAVDFAREHDLLLSVRGGGHNVAGLGTNDRGLVIDLSLMRDVQVNPEDGLVYAQGGATIGDLDTKTQQYGLAVPMGVVSATGIAGLTLGGGYGWLRNKYGLTADNLVAAEVVTADGRIVRASEDENSELLWGLRGGGGNFGVVTEFVYRAYPLGPEVNFVFVFHDGEGERMSEAIRYFRDYVATAPDEVSTILALGKIPPHEELFPKEIHGRPFVLYGGMYAGTAEEGRKIMGPLLDFGQPLADFGGIMPYLEAQTMFDEDYPDGLRYYWKSLNLLELNDEAIERIVDHARRQPSVFSTTDLWPVGGAVKRFTAEDSAFNGRQAAFLLSPEANWEDPADDEANITWLREFIADLGEFSDGSRYLNFPGFQEEGDEMMRQAFGSQYKRLAALKRKYDPDNFFRVNQNVKPSE